MGFVKTRQELEKYYSIKDRKFIGAKMMGVLFETKPEIVKRLLPEPLVPADAPGAMIFIAQYPETNLGPGYREAALFLRCKYGNEPGTYCLEMPIQSEESRLYNGRDIFGFPKKIAEIHLEKNGPAASGWVERKGIKFLELKVNLTGRLPGLPPSGPNFLFKGMPKIDLTPGFDGPLFLCKQQTEVEVQSLEIGSAELILRPSDSDPWAEVEPVKIMAGFFLVSNNTMLPGKVIKEVDGEAYLPYYFKITDFFAGK